MKNGGKSTRNRSIRKQSILLSVQSAAKSSQPTETPKESIALTSAISEIDLEAAAAMNRKELKAERLYLVSRSMAQDMLRKEIISECEFEQIDAILLETYHPILGTLLSGKKTGQKEDG